MNEPSAGVLVWCWGRWSPDRGGAQGLGILRRQQQQSAAPSSNAIAPNGA